MSCDRFEREGLLQLERGEPLDPHFESCADCRAARVAHEQLVATLASAGDDLEPPPHWQEGVWSRLRSERRQASSRSGRLALVARWLIAVAALALLAVGIQRLFDTAPQPVSLVAEVVPGPGVRRGGSAQVGDQLHLTATLGELPHAELRVYRDDRTLVLRCSDRPPCERRGEHLAARLELGDVGDYLPLLLLSHEPVADPTGDGPDADSAAALAAGARVEPGREIRVR